MTDAAPLRARLVPLLCVLFGAPVSAEYLQAYLSSTGDAVVMIGGLLILGPLYGGAALLVREVAVRTGRGWRGIALLGAAWGVLMSGVIDLSMFGAHRDDVAYWDLLREPTLIEPLGISAYTTLTWVSGHVLFSIFAPLGLLHALAPSQRGRPLLGRPGALVLTALLVVAALFIHSDGRRIYGYSPSPTQALAVLAVFVVLVTMAIGPLGRPGPPGLSTPPLPAWRVVAVPTLVPLLTYPVPPNWVGVGAWVLVLGWLAGVVTRWSRTRAWGPREIGLVAAGLVVGQTVAGFLSPVPDGVDPLTKTLSQLLLLACAVVLVALVARSRHEQVIPVHL